MRKGETQYGFIPGIYRCVEGSNKKESKIVIDTILEKGYCSTEDLKNAGYEHAPRAARDVRELGIPLETYKIKDSTGKSIAAYRFGDWEEAKRKNQLSKTSGRTQLTEKTKKCIIGTLWCQVQFIR